MSLVARNRYLFTVMAILSAVLCFVHLLSFYQGSGTRISIRQKKSEHFTIFALGDFGGVGRKPYSTRMQRQVAEAMAKQAELYNVSVIVSLGDNFYPHGVKNAEDPRFKTTFEDVYSAPALMRAKWLMVAGNHDYEGNITAQLEYSKKSPRWYFPYLYYTKVYRISETSNAIIQIVVIDTKLLCTESSKNRKSQGNSPSRQEHRQWLEKTLHDSKAEYLIVAGHNPIFSVGEHGGSPCLLSFLKPILDRYDVTAYFSGHDHNFQHIKEDDHRVNYFVSGNGNYHDFGNRKKYGSFQHSLKIIYGSSGGYTMINASSSSIRVAHINAKGNFIYSADISPRLYRGLGKIRASHN